MTTIEQIVELAALLPSGLGDSRAAEKMAAERTELLESLADGDTIGALTEVADAVYYAAKHIEYVASLCGITPSQALKICVAKYALRAQPGNPKNDAAERAAVAEVVCRSK